MLLFGGVGWVESECRGKHNKLLNLPINDEQSQNKQTTHHIHTVAVIITLNCIARNPQKRVIGPVRP